MESAITLLAGIVDSRQNLHAMTQSFPDVKLVRGLTFIGLIFIPLTYRSLEWKMITDQVLAIFRYTLPFLSRWL
jgi:hypothetical protein